MEHDFGSFVVSFATLGRGNANLGMLSIGGPSSLAPPLPGCIDGNVAGGIATHGRFEGDVSSTRQDVHIGDSVNFQDDLFDEVCLIIQILLIIPKVAMFDLVTVICRQIRH